MNVNNVDPNAAYGNIRVYGGTFVNFNHSAADTDDNGAEFNPVNYVVENYTVEEETIGEDKYYTVVYDENIEE